MSPTQKTTLKQFRNLVTRLLVVAPQELREAERVWTEQRKQPHNVQLNKPKALTEPKESI